MISPCTAKHTSPHTLLASDGKGGTKGEYWINVDRPLTEHDLKDRLVLLDFWTYGCINCMQIIPDLEYLEQRFGKELLVIGVHSAKFSGEQASQRIQSAAKRFNLRHPVINDYDFRIWKAFNVRAWPTQILLGPDGEEINRYVGEGKRAAIEKDINNFLQENAHLIQSKEQNWSLDDAKAKENLLYFPARLAFGRDMIFVADAGHNRILGFDNNHSLSVTIGSGTEGLKDGNFKEATFNNPRGLLFMHGFLYVADTDNHALRRINLDTGQVETLSGNGKRGQTYRGKNMNAKKTELASPWDLEDMGDGRSIAIAMAGTHQLWRYDTIENTLSLLAGSGAENIDDGAAFWSTLAQPSGLSLSGQNLFFVDAESSSLRTLDIQNGRITTLIGTGLFDFGLKDGTYPHAMLQHPQGLWADEEKIYIADTYNNALRMYDRKTRILSTLSLEGLSLNEPGDIVRFNNQLWITDTNHHKVHIIDQNTGSIQTIPRQ